MYQGKLKYNPATQTYGFVNRGKFEVDSLEHEKFDILLNCSWIPTKLIKLNNVWQLDNLSNIELEDAVIRIYR